MAKLAGAGFLLAAGLLSGCVNPYPQPIVNVSEKEAVSLGANKVRVMKPSWLKDNPYSGLNAAQNLSDLRLNLDIYSRLYEAQYNGLVNTLSTATGQQFWEGDGVLQAL